MSKKIKRLREEVEAAFARSNMASGRNKAAYAEEARKLEAELKELESE